MSEPATFEEADWAELTGPDKKALSAFSRVSQEFDALSTATGVGQKSMDSLMAKGLAVEGEPSIHGRTFKITDKGWLAIEWINGRRTRVYPQS